MFKQVIISLSLSANALLISRNVYLVCDVVALFSDNFPNRVLRSLVISFCIALLFASTS